MKGSMHIINNDYFAVEEDGRFAVYTFGERCEPVKKMVTMQLEDAKQWANTFGQEKGRK